MGLFKKKKQEDISVKATPSTSGWDSIVSTFQSLYPTQTNPLHYGVLISWQLGGNDPLQGISVYETPTYYHFVTFGFSELYEKEGTDPYYSGYGFELTLKLKKDALQDNDAEIKNICGILQSIARITFTQGELFSPNEYIYTGQQTGIDANRRSCLTGFLTTLDEAGVIETPNGKVSFVELIGASDAELQAIIQKETQVEDLLDKLGHTLTDYARTSLV